MFYEIKINVIDVRRKINLARDLMFPIPPLPDAALTLSTNGSQVQFVPDK